MSENSNTGTLELITIELTKLINPLKERVEQFEILQLFAELGVEFPPELAENTTPQGVAFNAALNDIVTKVRSMPDKVKAMIDALNATPQPQYEVAATQLVDLIEIIVALVSDIQVVANRISDYVAVHPVSDPAAVGAFIADLAKNLFDYLVVNYIDTSVPLLGAFLEFFGVIEEEDINVGSTNPLLPQVTRKTLKLENLPKLITDPVGLANELYGWGSASLTLNAHSQIKLFKKLEKLFNKFNWPAVYDSTTTPHHLDLLLASLKVYTGGGAKEGIQLAFDHAIGTEFDRTLSQDKWELALKSVVSITPNVGVNLVPDQGLSTSLLSGTSPEIRGVISLKWTAVDNVTQQPLLLFGTAGKSRLEAKKISAFIGTEFKWQPATSIASGNVTFEAEIKDGKLVIKPDSPDGFLAKVLPPEGFTLDFGVLLGISSEKGLYFKGSGTLEIDIPTNITLGPISILNLTVGLSFGEQLALSLGADIKTVLGPFTAIVENMGIKVLLDFPSTRDGNLGVVNLGLEFKPPRGIGMSLDAGAVKGGGYLMLDYENGRYAGALELEFSGLFGFTAIGIINTKFPDGSEGFSLLLLINVTFGTPITLGYNFYLTGVGGIIGLHRTMNTEKIRDGVRDGSISNVLFPENVVANITRIISDMEAFFPAKQDQFFLGFMARITWNTPAILTIEAGLAIEFPNPVKIAILGVIRCLLPDPDNSIIRLNVAFAGIIDFEKKLLSFDASIFDSRILTITLEGDMALRVSWSDQPDFLVSVGGFHPTYTPAPHLELKPMKRITVSILSGNPNLVLTAYFAVTTNTIQFGAALDFSFRVSSFGIFGKLSFDVLIQFSPFHFIANIHASVDVKLGGSTLFAIGLDFNLEGPAPWHAYGYASFSILFFTIRIKFDKTWGEERGNSLPGTDVLPLLLEELNKDSNWEAIPAEHAYELVTLSPAASDPDAILVRPFGSLEVNQNVLPLDMTLERFGNYTPQDISRATVTQLSVNGVNYSDATLTDVQKSFAPAAFKDMSDQDKLTSPSYSKQNAGVRLNSTDEIKFDYGINRIVNYECIISDKEVEKKLDRVTVKSDFFRPFVSGGDVGKSFLSKHKKSNAARADKFVSMAEETYAVASVSTMQNAHASNVIFSSKSEADEYLRETIAQHPSQKGKLQITPAFQLA